MRLWQRCRKENQGSAEAATLPILTPAHPRSHTITARRRAARHSRRLKRKSFTEGAHGRVRAATFGTAHKAPYAPWPAAPRKTAQLWAALPSAGEQPPRRRARAPHRCEGPDAPADHRRRLAAGLLHNRKGYANSHAATPPARRTTAPTTGAADSHRARLPPQGGAHSLATGFHALRQLFHCFKCFLGNVNDCLRFYW